MKGVQRFLLAVVVTLLVFSASGILTLVVLEPCTTSDVAGKDDGTCPPTCVACGCCAQAVDVVAVLVVTSPELIACDVRQALPSQPQATSSDILHVPKRVRA